MLLVIDKNLMAMNLNTKQYYYNRYTLLMFHLLKKLTFRFENPYKNSFHYNLIK